MALKDYLGDYGAAYELPEIAGRYSEKGLVVVGDGQCVWDDLQRFGCRHNHGRGSVYRDGWDFLTVNKIIEVFPGHVEHAYSNEPKLLEAFIRARRQEYTSEFPNSPKYTHSCRPGAKWQWPWHGRGSSLLGATLTGLALGYDRVVICGGPLDNAPHNGEPHWRKCRFENSEVADQVDGKINEPWLIARDRAFDGRVRSMSGRPKIWLGNALEWA